MKHLTLILLFIETNNVNIYLHTYGITGLYTHLLYLIYIKLRSYIFNILLYVYIM